MIVLLVALELRDAIIIRPLRPHTPLLMAAAGGGAATPPAYWRAA